MNSNSSAALASALLIGAAFFFLMFPPHRASESQALTEHYHTASPASRYAH